MPTPIINNISIREVEAAPLAGIYQLMPVLVEEETADARMAGDNSEVIASLTYSKRGWLFTLGRLGQREPALRIRGQTVLHVLAKLVAVRAARAAKNAQPSKN